MTTRWHRLRAFFLRPAVGATGVLETIRPPGPSALKRAEWVHWLFRYSGWYFVLVAAAITVVPTSNKRPLPVREIVAVLLAYAAYTTSLELISRVWRQRYDEKAFRVLRLLITTTAVSALVALDPHQGSYFWFFYLLPALQSFIYFGRVGLTMSTTLILIVYGALTTGSRAGAAQAVDYLIVALNAAILLFASFVLSWLFSAAQDRRNLLYLTALRRISRDVVASLTLRDALQVTLEQGLRALSAKGGSVMLFDLTSQELRVEAWVADGRVDVDKKHRVFKLGEGLAGTVAETGVLINAPDVFLDDRYQASFTGRPIRSMLVVPIGNGRHVMGTISVDSPRPGVFRREEEEFLAALGDYLAIAVEAHHLRSITTALSTVRVDDVLDEIVKSAAALTGADSATMFLRKPGTSEVERKARFPVRPDAEPPRAVGGLTQLVLETGDDVTIDDARLDGRVRDAVLSRGVRSVLGVPLRARASTADPAADAVIGVLFVNARQTAMFSARDAQLLRGLAGQAAIAIENSRLFADSEWRASQLFTLHDVANSLHSERHLPTLLDLISQSACRLLGGDSAAILQKDDPGDYLTIKGSHELRAETVAGTRIRVGEGIAGRVVSTGDYIIVDDVRTDPRIGSPYLTLERILSMVTVPLRLGAETIGTLGVHSRTACGAFADKHAQILSLLASQAAAAIGNAAAYESALRRADLATTLESLYRASVDLTRHKSVPELMQSILQTAVKALKSDGGGLYLSDIFSYATTVPPQCSLVAVAGLPLSEKGRTVALDTGVVGRVILEDKPIAKSGYDQWDERVRDYDRYGIKAVAAAPISWARSVRGALAVHSTNPERDYSAEDLNVLSLLGTFAAVALENAKRTDDYDRLFTSTLDAIIAVDESGLVVNCNPQAERLLGYPEGGLTATSVVPLYHDAAEARRINGMLRSSPDGRIEDHQTYVRGAGGERIPISLSASLLYDYERKRAGSVGYFRDLRAIKSAQREIRLLQSVLSASGAITQLGEPGTVLQAIVQNTVTAMGAMRVVLWRYDNGQLRAGEHVSCDAAPTAGAALPDVEIAESLLTHIIGNPRVSTSDDTADTALGSWIGCSLTAGDQPIGVMLCMYGARHAFTDRERTVFRLFADVAAIALKNADQANELETVAWTSALASWQAILAHDVHREAGAIRRGLRILHDRPDLPHDVKDRLNELDTYTQALVLPTEKGPEMAANVVDCIQRELDLARKIWPSIRWRLEPHADLPKIRVSPWWLRRIVKQLLRNAHDAMPPPDVWPRRDVTVTLRRAEDEKLVVCEVQDTGPGFDKRIEPLLFRRLIKREGSKGWGLLQVSSTLRECGGSARVLWNRPPEGACFELRFPIVH